MKHYPYNGMQVHVGNPSFGYEEMLDNEESVPNSDFHWSDATVRHSSYCIIMSDFILLCIIHFYPVYSTEMYVILPFCSIIVSHTVFFCWLQ